MSIRARHDVEIVIRPRTAAGRRVARTLEKEIARSVASLEVGRVALAGTDWGYLNGERIAQIDRLTELEAIANGEISMLVRRDR